jgi:hypothetical protein
MLMPRLVRSLLALSFAFLFLVLDGGLKRADAINLYVKLPDAGTFSAITGPPTFYIDLDFGNVPVGSTAHLQLSAYWNLDPSTEVAGFVSYLPSNLIPTIVGPPFYIENTNSFCSSGPNLSCTWDLAYSPTVPTLSDNWWATLMAVQAGVPPNGYLQYTFQVHVSGTGITTPIPPAFALFATGLGALGLLGWRRKRKALAA